MIFKCNIILVILKQNKINDFNNVPIICIWVLIHAFVMGWPHIADIAELLHRYSYRERPQNFEWITISKPSLLRTIYMYRPVNSSIAIQSPLVFFDIDFSFETTTLLYHLISSDYRILTHSVISVLARSLCIDILSGFTLHRWNVWQILVW